MTDEDREAAIDLIMGQANEAARQVNEHLSAAFRLLDNPTGDPLAAQAIAVGASLATSFNALKVAAAAERNERWHQRTGR